MSEPTIDEAEALAALEGAMASAASEITTVAELREWAESTKGILPVELPTVGRLDDGVILGSVEDREVVADVIRPEGDGPFPVLVWLHGGGWVLGSRVDYRPLACEFARAGFVVVNVDYGLAPEHPFPAAYDDCMLAMSWVRDGVTAYDGDPTRLVLAGDSAGANLAAAVVATSSGDPTIPRAAAALLFYGVYDMPTMPDDDSENSKKLVADIKRSYLGPDHEALLSDPRVSPLLSADQFPPTFVAVGGADSLVGQAQVLADALAAGGIEHEHVVVPEMPHGFVQLPLPPAAEAIASAVRFAFDQLKVAPQLDYEEQQ